MQTGVSDDNVVVVRSGWRKSRGVLIRVLLHMSVYVYVFGYLLRILCEGRERERENFFFARAFFWDFGISRHLCVGCCSSSKAELSVYTQEIIFFVSLSLSLSLSLACASLFFLLLSSFFFFLPEREKERDLKRGDDDYESCKIWSDRSSANE